MAAPATTDDFLDLVRKSELIDPFELSAHLDARSARAALPHEPKQLARLLVKDGLLTKFQAEQLLGGKYKPFTLSGKYRLLERLGIGGMGFVYLCEHLSLRRRVAIKVLPTAQSESPSALQRFRREARASAVLDHPNLVRTHDLDHDGKMHFLVMDYVNGRSFQEIVAARGPLSIERAAHYVAQAASGLQHAHERGLVHRDVKPANLLLDRGGVVKLLDLGLARFFHDDADDLTRQHGGKSVLGTADYVAPEQARDSHGADIRADVYSLGCTFYFLLTGTPPFHARKSLGQKLMAHQAEQPASVRASRPEVSQELAAVLEKMLEKAPEDRYQTPAELFDALEPWTRNAIAPPAVEEMPQFCPAVQAGNSTITSRNLTLSAINLGSKIQFARASSTPPPPSRRIRAARKNETSPVPSEVTQRAGGPFIWTGVVAALLAAACAYLLH